MKWHHIRTGGKGRGREWLLLGLVLAEDDDCYKVYDCDVRGDIGGNFHRGCGGGFLNTTTTETGRGTGHRILSRRHPSEGQH